MFEEVIKKLSPKKQKQLAKILTRRTPKLLKQGFNLQYWINAINTLEFSKKITNPLRFMKNSLRHRWKIADRKTTITDIDALQLNTSHLERRLSKTKNALQKSITRMKKLIKTPRIATARKLRLEKQVQRIKKLMHSLTPDTLQ